MLGVRCILATAVLVGAVSVGVLPAVAQQQSGSWGGIYFGAYIGAGQGSTSSSATKNSTTSSTGIVPGPVAGALTTIDEVTTFGGSGDGTGAVADLFLGYNAMVTRSFLFGVQVEGTIFSDLSFSSKGVANSDVHFFQTDNTGAVLTEEKSTSSQTARSGDDLTAVVSGILRGGYLMTPDSLIYALGGVSFGNFSSSDAHDLHRWGSQFALGYTVGAGLELKVSANWSVRAEYRYLAFDLERSEVNSSSSAAPGSSQSSSTADSLSSDFEMHLGKIGVVYKLN